MPSLRIVAAVTAIAGSALLSASCESVVSPCAKVDAQDVGRTATANLIDGTWALATIDGNPIPEPGFQVAPGQFIRAGVLHFRTDRVVGSCDDAKESAGNVIVQYVLVDGAGLGRPGLSASGGFEYVAESDVVRIDAFERETSGVATGSRLVISNLSPARFPNLQLEFRR
jgi:hypothetical protein